MEKTGLARHEELKAAERAFLEESTPAHYQFPSCSPLDVIEDWGLGFNLGNVIKYVARAYRKHPEDPTKDLEKALFYLNRELEKAKGNLRDQKF